MAGQEPAHDVVFAFPGLEIDQRDPGPADEPVDTAYEPRADRHHQRRRRDREPPLPEEPHHPALVLQPGLIQVQIQPVDATHHQRRVLAEHRPRRPDAGTSSPVPGRSAAYKATTRIAAHESARPSQRSHDGPSHPPPPPPTPPNTPTRRGRRSPVRDTCAQLDSSLRRRCSFAQLRSFVNATVSTSSNTSMYRRTPSGRST